MVEFRNENKKFSKIFRFFGHQFVEKTAMSQKKNVKLEKKFKIDFSRPPVKKMLLRPLKMTDEYLTKIIFSSASHAPTIYIPFKEVRFR